MTFEERVEARQREYAIWLGDALERRLAPEPWSRRWWRALGRRVLAEFRAAWREHAVTGNAGAERDRLVWVLVYGPDGPWRRYVLSVPSPYAVVRTFGVTW